MDNDVVLSGGINVAARLCCSIHTFPAHMHYEVEVLYCVHGSLITVANGKTYEIVPGQAFVAGSMMEHEIKHRDKDTVILAIEIGPLLLREYFAKLAAIQIDNSLISPDGGEQDKHILDILQSLTHQCGEKAGSNALALAADVYKLSAYLIEKYGTDEKPSRSVLSIEKTLTYICENYSCNISVEEAAEIAGYAPTSFCRVFKKITGMGFHEYLNHFRVRTARYVLLNTDLNIETVATQVGYPDAKTFCRVFKNLSGETPLHYRKRNNTK